MVRLGRSRWVAAFVLGAGALLGCTCQNFSTPCDYGRSSFVVVARVLVDSGDRSGERNARVVVEESLSGDANANDEFDVDTQAKTSCYVRLRKDARYILFASKDRAGRGLLHAGACSHLFLVAGSEHILNALRAKRDGKETVLVGRIGESRADHRKPYAPLSGARVALRDGAAVYESRSRADGLYEISGIKPGRYQLSVTKQNFVPNDEFNNGVKENPGGIEIPARSCKIRDLEMWANGRITGVIRNMNGRPLAGVSVQAFVYDVKNERQPRAFRTEKTDANGRYAVGRLPAGKYLIGVNGSSQEDDGPWPPTLAHAAASPGQAVDLALPPPRNEANVRVHVKWPDGRPLADAYVELKAKDGKMRQVATRRTNAEGLLDANVILGESYDISAHTTFLHGKVAMTVTHSGQVAVVFANRN